MAKHFFKYHGAGNDFILIDNRDANFQMTDANFIQKLCAYHTGIGSDGLILINQHDDFSFEMKYFNADGLEGTLCGNGSRCAVLFAKHLGLIVDNTVFLANDGIHEAWIDRNIITVTIRPVKRGSELLDGIWLDTGSPHLVVMVSNLNHHKVAVDGPMYRNHEDMSPDGANINFVEQLDDERFSVRTYERGVERETLSCGTGAVAVALAMHQTKRTVKTKLKIEMPGGHLEVSFDLSSKGYDNIRLSGPASFVFKGEWS